MATETALSPQAVHAARPTVRVAGQAHDTVTELLLSMDMTEHEGGMSTLEMRFSNIASNPSGGSDFAFEDNQVLKLAAEIAVYGGDQNAPQEIFRGTVTGLDAEFPGDGPPELVVLAEDRLQRARMARRTQLHENVSIADVANAIAGRYGLTPSITGFGDQIGTWMQLNESDLAFLRRLLARYDGDVQVVGPELHLSPRKDVQRGSLTLELAGQLRRARVVADLSHQVTEITVTGWDATQGRRVNKTSTGTTLGPGTGRAGKQVLEDAGPRAEHIGQLAVMSDPEAQALADATFDRRARRFVCVEGVAEGNPALRVGTHLSLSGLGPRFDNTYYVVRACHRYDQENGYQTEFEAECAYLGGAA
jgi:phage protein D